MISPINHDNPIKVYPDGSMWCALVGENIQEGLASFARTPVLAVQELYSMDEVAQYIPHAVYEMQCEQCGSDAVYVVPHPYAFESIECSKCGSLMLIEQDLVGQDSE